MIKSRLRHLLKENDLHAELAADFGAQNPAGRGHLREAIARHLRTLLGPLTTEEEAQIRDLSRPLTRVRGRGISISHTRGLGGFLSAPRACGFDVEMVSRVNEKAVARVSKPAELRSAPSPAHLWTAKEAAYKAFGSFDDVSLLSRIETVNWSPLDKDSRSGIFQAKNLSDSSSPSGLGCVIESEIYLIAAFLFLP
ncbi:MAG: 4'-phosphopantetheinyl transferase superfamily protein [Bdellovibrionaceae bacterium]|nr:4'-phosphopantetheinyl transferase superfamily protein [Pseudobdellovibrionaceae bacterium]